MVRTLTAIVRAGLILISILGLSANGRSQTLESYLSDLKSAGTSTQKQTLKMEQPVLDQVVNPHEYLVGPGDFLLLNILGEVNYSYQINITPEGTAIIPSIGSVGVAGITLAEAKERITAKVLKNYRGVDVTVTLVGLREFLVSVVGEVGKPGVYTARASQRAVDLLQQAGGLAYKASKRNIQVRKRDGSVKWVDLAKFERAGDYKRNPYLQEGDVILVPVEQTELGRVGVYGAVRKPGEFEFCPGDSLFDLIELGQGIRDDALLEEAGLIRFQPDGNSSVMKLNLSHVYASNPGPENIPLQPEDRLFIQFKPVPFAKAEATILGEVNLPGTYPIVEGKTKLSELVNMAGGFGPKASLTEAHMFRTSFASLADETYMRLIESSPNSLRPEEMEYLKIQKSGTAGKVSVDFVRLFEQNDLTQDRVLRDEDSIYVPQPSMVVNVAGQVVRSGLGPYSEKMSASDFVQEAGGFSGRADRGKIYVIKRGTGEWTRLGGKQKIEPGDTIWVPMKPDKSFWSSFKEVMVVVGSVATTYFVIDQAAK